VSTCVIVFKGKQPAKELVLKLRDAQTTITHCDLIEPLSKKMDSEAIKIENTEDVFINQLNFNNVKLLNPKLGKKERQKTLATWLVPFGFFAGLSFSQMTHLQTFADMGFPNQFEKLLGGLVGMIGGWLGSLFSAGGINQENDDDIRALRKKSEQGFWLLIIELPIETELPWGILQDTKCTEIINIGKE
tara:strand:+ start:22 stop:588 length:567 start_codon:yes stop_codon:yes gene_type:complete